MDGYYAIFIIGSIVFALFSFITYLCEDYRAFTLFSIGCSFCLLMLLLPRAMYKETVCEEEKLNVTMLDGAYYAKIKDDVVNLNNKLGRNFSPEDEFFIKRETDRYTLFGDFVKETPFVKESK